MIAKACISGSLKETISKRETLASSIGQSSLLKRVGLAFAVTV